jgi:Contact-dependent growth inhibition CdiA C-terminal domain
LIGLGGDRNITLGKNPIADDAANLGVKTGNGLPTNAEPTGNPAGAIDDTKTVQTGSQNSSINCNAGKLIGNLDNLTPAERVFVERQLSKGSQVEVIPTGADRTPDFEINGTRFELKTVSGVENATSDGISKAISNRVMNGRGQAVDIVVDATKQSGITEEIARRGIIRAYGADNKLGAKIQSITIEGSEFSITVPRQ